MSRTRTAETEFLLQKRNFKKSSDSGTISLDFLLSFVVVMGFSYILLAIALTLSFVEVVQYISFSSARAYFVSHFTQERQSSSSDQKLNKLLANKEWAHFFDKGGWFEIDTTVPLERHREADGSDVNRKNIFLGRRVRMKINLLNINIPFVGSSTEDALTTPISSLLGRESSMQECVEFMKGRNEVLGSEYGIRPIWIADNGC